MTTSSVSSSTTATTNTAVAAATTTTSDTASLGSALLTAMGAGGTGTDMTNMATEISAAEYMTQTSALTTQQATVTTQISEASQLKSDLLTLNSSLSSLIDGSNLIPSPTVTNASVASASLPIGSSGSTSSYSLEVSQLAQPQVLSSASLSNSVALKGGTMSFAFGTVNTTTSGGTTTSTFARDTTKASASVTIPDGATLAQAASAINGANIGVTAYVATNANGQQLVIKGAQGADSAFTITSADSTTAASTGTSLSSLAYDPAASSNATTLVQSAMDAAYKLDGISRTSATNAITSAAPGLSLTLTGTNVGAPTTITYSDPSSNITSAMTNLVSALNSLVTEMNTDTSASSGKLYNDPGAKAMSRAFGTLTGMTIMPNATAGQPQTLADLGVSMDKDGNFSLNSTILQTALAANTGAVAAMFTKGVNGIYGTLNTMITNLTTSTDPGSLDGSVTRYTALQTSLTTQQSNIATLQSQLRTRLVSQYAAANASVAASNSTLTFLKNQIAAWNSTSS